MLSRCERMEQEKKKKRKRVREEKGGNKIVGSSFEENKNNAKKRGYEISFKKDKDKVKEEEKEECFWDSDSSNLAFGVFDFPWLKDGVISKPEELKDFEDNYFMSCLEHQDSSSSFNVSGIDYFSDEYGLCETLEHVSMSHIPESKLVEDAWNQFDETNDMDNSIWTSLFNHPL